MKAGTLRFFINLWPPLFFAGIRASSISEDFRTANVELKLRWYNRNYVGTQFGGSLFSMTDPWYMVMLMHNLGRDYFVWDKHADIEFIAPGRGHVSAHFHLDDETIASIRANTAEGQKYLPQFIIDIVDADKQLVARVKRTLYVRKKPAARAN
jgi:acyl-coenzyme A thioesterase PaaI-like protein